MVSMPSGLVLTPQLMARQVSIDMHFEPSVGILARKVDKLSASIRSFREPLKRSVKEVMIPSIRKNFDAEGRPSWAPLADATVLKRGTAHPILNDSGALKATMGLLKIWHIDTEKAMITDLPQNVWYGKVHQAGMGAAEIFEDPVSGATHNIGEDGSIPARPFVMIQPEDEEAMERIFSLWVAERVRMAGL